MRKASEMTRGDPHQWDDDERAALVELLRSRPERMTWREIAAEISTAGSALSVRANLVPAPLFGGDDDLDQAKHDIQSWRASGIGFLTFLDRDYPAALREVQEMPPLLFYRGTLRPFENAISVVGSRSASERGITIAGTIARNLVQRGITVISGLASGIDTTAHRSALDDGGRTVACIGTGINRHYPAENKALQERIGHDGLVLSQFWPDTPPTRQNFPMRNAIMSGYGQATVIVEAGENSGARIQARQAVEHGRQVILTDSVATSNAWAQRLINRPGVHVAENTRDVMDLVERTIDAECGTSLFDRLLALRGEWKSP